MTPLNIGMPVLMDDKGNLIFCDQPLPAGYVEFVLKVYGSIVCAALLATACVLLAHLQ